MQTSWYLTNSYQDFEFEENHGFTIILKDTKVFFFSSTQYLLRKYIQNR